MKATDFLDQSTEASPQKPKKASDFLNDYTGKKASSFLDAYTHEPSTLQKVAQATGVPMRGMRGIGVGVEKLFTGEQPRGMSRVGEAAEAATRATQPDYEPKKGEKIGSFAGEMMDPRFMALGEVGAVGKGVVKTATAGAAALGGTQVIEDYAKSGKLDPKKEAIIAGEGAAGAVAIHGLIKAAGGLFSWLTKPAESVDLGSKPVDIVKTISDKASEGKTVEQISSETGLPHKTIKESLVVSDPIDTAPLHEMAQAANGVPAATLKLVQKSLREQAASGTEPASLAKKLFLRRYGDIGSGLLDSHLFVTDVTKGLSGVERQAIPFVIEGKLPESDKFNLPNAKEILETAKHFLSDPNAPENKQMAQAVNRIGAYYDEGHQFLKENFDDVGYVDNYVTHIWDREPQTYEGGPGKTSLSKKNPFTKQRFIASYADGINQGMTPKTMDIGDLLKVYDNYKVKTIANLRFRDSLNQLYVEGGLPSVMPVDKAPAGWKTVDSTFFTGLRIHPEVFDAVKAAVDKPFAFSIPGPNATVLEKGVYRAAHSYETLNAWLKSIRLSLSFFHHLSLTETAMAGGVNPFKVALEAGKDIFGRAEYKSLKELPSALYASFKEGHAAWQNIPLAKDAMNYGLELGAISDVQTNRITKTLMDVEQSVKDVPIASKTIKGIRTFKEVWDKSLWDYYHSGIKLQMYQQHLSENLQKFGDKMSVEEIKQATATEVNRAAGGALETMMLSPKFRQALHWTFLAPDWTITRLYSAGSIFQGGPIGYQARKFWLKAGLGYYAAANMMNYMTTAKFGLKGQYGEGRLLHENEPGKKLHVFLRKDKDGRNQYVMAGKTFTEVVGWFEHPLQTLGAKSAPVIQMVADAYMKSKTAYGAHLPKDQQSLKAFLVRNIMPISTSGSNYMFTLPLSKGMSKSEVIDKIERGLRDGDQKSFNEAIKFGIENGYTMSSLVGVPVRDYKTELKREALTK